MSKTDNKHHKAIHINGHVAEWFKALAWKAGWGQLLAGSDPVMSAINITARLLAGFVFMMGMYSNRYKVR